MIPKTLEKLVAACEAYATVKPVDTRGTQELFRVFLRGKDDPASILFYRGSDPDKFIVGIISSTGVFSAVSRAEFHSESINELQGYLNKKGVRDI